MSKEIIIDIELFKKGFQDLADTTKAPIGSLRIMKNSQVTNKGGLSPREGVTLLGTNNTSTSVCKGFYSYKKSFSQNEYLIKAYGNRLEVYSANNSSAGWFLLKTVTTSDQEFGFVTSLVNTANEDYLVGCNRYDPYFSWTGAVTALNGALVGGETTITVDSTIGQDIFESQLATANTSTTLTVSTVTWAASQWNNFYVHITSGAQSGKVRKITATASTSITFDTLTGVPGNCTFEICRLAFPPTGSIIYAGLPIAYTAIDTSTTFTVATANAAPDNTIVSIVPTDYPGLPRGDRLTNYLGRVIVGDVRSAMARDSGGALAGFSSGGSAFVSKLLNPFDFSYTATRIAGEGDVIGMPYGGGEITDVQSQEDSAYVFKNRYIEQLQYSQDANDLAVRTPLKSGVGSVGKTLKASDDIYFITPDKRITSIGRVTQKDVKPETENIGLPVQNFLNHCGIDDIGRGEEIENKLYFPLKSTVASQYNDIMLIYNKSDKGYFEGIWDLPAFAIADMEGSSYYAESNSANVYQMFNGQHSDIVGDDRYPIISEVATHFMNLTTSKFNLQAAWGLGVEGYIRAGSRVTYNMFKEFEVTPFFTLTFVADAETGLLDGNQSFAFLGGQPLALHPLAATFSDPLADGRRHFQFHQYFPYIYANYFSIGQFCSDADSDFETVRWGLFIKEDPVNKISKIRQA